MSQGAKMLVFSPHLAGLSIDHGTSAGSCDIVLSIGRCIQQSLPGRLPDLDLSHNAGWTFQVLAKDRKECTQSFFCTATVDAVDRQI